MEQPKNSRHEMTTKLHLVCEPANWYAQRDDPSLARQTFPRDILKCE